MKQTAVEWLINEILSIPLEEATNVAHLKKYVNKLQIFEHAKKMEKQQIIDTYIECKRQYVLQENCYPPQFVVKEAEQYYNETFKNK